MAANPLSKLTEIITVGEVGVPLLDAEAAVFLRVETGTLSVWRAQKRGPKYVLVGTSPRYLLADLKAYLLEAKPKKRVGAGVGRPPKQVRRS